MKRSYIAQVITFDVLYDIEEAKTELQYLFSVIDMFDLSDNNKKMFLRVCQVKCVSSFLHLFPQLSAV